MAQIWNLKSRTLVTEITIPNYYVYVLGPYSWIKLDNSIFCLYQINQNTSGENSLKQFDYLFKKNVKTINVREK